MAQCKNARITEMLMIDDEPTTPVAEELLLSNEDFPTNYVNFAHPEDYIISNQPIQPEKIFHQYKFRHPRLLLRVSWKIGENEFFPISFVLDTGAPKIYLNATVFQHFTQRNIIHIVEDMGVMFVKLFDHNYIVEETPLGHAPANIIGLKTLCHLGLQLTATPSFGFTFQQDFQFFNEQLI